jgi:hypothetical protein
MTPAEAAFRAEVDEFCPVRPELLEVRPAGDGRFEIHIQWRGRESVLRAVFLRRVLAQAGVESHPSTADDGRGWALRVGPVPPDRVGQLIDSSIW